METLRETNFTEIGVPRRGKVRDVYDLGESLLIVASDRLSAFDVVLPTGIPDKGKVLTKLSTFWFREIGGIIENHVIETDVEKYPEPLKRYKDQLRDRSMIVRKAKVVPIECVVRGYLAGSGWKEYKESRAICGIRLPEGLLESSKLQMPIFTPTTKADEGHDMNVTFGRMSEMIGERLAERLVSLSISIYEKAYATAERRGIIIADTKFEFGLNNGEVTLIDEVLTPDSSRFWPRDLYAPGRAQPSFDKQFVRDYLETLDWDKTPPAPMLPGDIVEKTSAKYLEAFKKITGKDLL